MAESNLLKLDGEHRLVQWKDTGRNRTRRFIFHRPTKASAGDYFRRCAKTEHEGMISYDRAQETAKDQLFRDLVVRAEGYVVEGGADFMSLPDWKLRVPKPDRNLAVGFLFAVAASTNADLPDVGTDYDVVALEAWWGVEGDPKMAEFDQLLHRLEPMSDEDEVALRDQLSSGMPVGGSRKGEVIRPVAELVLITWYDRKIREVSGYSVGGQAVTSVEEIRAWMDPFHRLAVMRALREASPNFELPKKEGAKSKEEASCSESNTTDQASSAPHGN